MASLSSAGDEPKHFERNVVHRIASSRSFYGASRSGTDSRAAGTLANISEDDRYDRNGAAGAGGNIFTGMVGYCTPAVVGRGGIGVVNCLRERREPLTGESDGKTTGSGDPSGAGCGSGKNCAAVIDGECAARACGRSGGTCGVLRVLRNDSAAGAR